MSKDSLKPFKYLLSIIGLYGYEQCMAETDHTNQDSSYFYCVLQKGHFGSHQKCNGEKFKRTNEEKGK